LPADVNWYRCRTSLAADGIPRLKYSFAAIVLIGEDSSDAGLGAGGAARRL
jgi:hypothetical protein